MKKSILLTAFCAAVGATMVLSSCSGEVEEKTEHKHGFVYVETVKPDCTDYGYDLYRCNLEITDENGKPTACGFTEERNKKEALGHEYVDYICTRCNTIDPNAPYTDGLAFAPVLDKNNKVISYTVSGKGTAEIDNYIKIPTSYKPNGATDSKNVTAIGEGVFANLTGVKIAVLPSSMIEIGDGAFSGCTALSNPIALTGVKHIGENAFKDCAKIPSLDLSFHSDTFDDKGANDVCDSAFEGCSALESVTMSSTVKHIAADAFKGCVKIAKMTVPYAANEVSETSEGETVYEPKHFGYIFGAADYSHNMTSVPTTLESLNVIGEYDIPENAFNGCVSIKNVEIESGVEHIGYGAFKNCNRISAMTMPYAVSESTETNGSKTYTPKHFGYLFGAEEYGQNGTAVPKSLEKVSISGVKDIAENAFNGCTGLKDVEIIGIMGNICDGAFEGCTALKTVVIPASLLTIGKNAFKNCSALDGIVTDKAETNCIVLPEWIETVDFGAFEGVKRIKYITMPYAVKDGKHLSYIFGATDHKQGANYIPTSLESIKVTGKKNVGDNAFYGLKIKKIEISNKIRTVGNSAFSNCANLAEISLGYGIEKVGDDAFLECAALKKVYYAGSIARYGTIEFGNKYSSPICYKADLIINGNVMALDKAN